MFNEYAISFFPNNLNRFVLEDGVFDELHSNDNDAIMEQIREDLRESLPLNATLPSEKIVVPTVGEVSNYENLIFIVCELGSYTF